MSIYTIIVPWVMVKKPMNLITDKVFSPFGNIVRLARTQTIIQLS